MTPQEINEAVARKLGWMKDKTGHWHDPPEAGQGDCWDVVPDYCHSIAAAWTVVESIALVGLLSYVEVGRIKLQEFDPKTAQCINEPIYYYCNINIKGRLFGETAVIAPMAICLAYLKHKDGV